MAERRGRDTTLVPCEREVSALLAKGRLKKQVAGEIGIVEITAQAHRGEVMRNIRVFSPPDLTRMVDKLMLASENTPGRQTSM